MIKTTFPPVSYLNCYYLTMAGDWQERHQQARQDARVEMRTEARIERRRNKNGSGKNIIIIQSGTF